MWCVFYLGEKRPQSCYTNLRHFLSLPLYPVALIALVIMRQQYQETWAVLLSTLIPIDPSEDKLTVHNTIVSFFL